MNKMTKVKYLAYTSILSAVTIILTLISNSIVIGGISINLGLIAIILAGILVGPLSGAFVGLINGAFALLSAQAFFAISPLGTVLVCLLKTSVAGLVCGLIYRLLKNKNELVAIIVSAMLVPIINTSLFIVGSLFFFNGAFGNLISIFVSINFVVELLVNAVLIPTIIKVIKIIKK